MEEYYYTTLQGEKFNLTKLNKAQKELIKRFYSLYQAGHEFVGFLNAMNTSYNLKIMGAPCLNGQCWINLKVLHSVVYSVLQDLGNRLAIQQAFLKEYKYRNAGFTKNEKVLKTFLKL